MEIIINGLGLETELRLGLPGGHEGGKNEKKRAFLEFFECEGETKKNQVVGWPPVRACRQKKILSLSSLAKMYVKVSMDGAPFLRKIDLEKHKGYADLVMAVEQLFGCFGIGKVSDENDDCEYAVIYEDKDGDWMLLGDVPWEMFIESCKRLRITKKPADETSGNGLEAKDLLKGLLEKESSQ